MKNKMTNNKIAKGIVSLTIIVVLLLSVLAGSFYYQNNITANAVKEASADFDKNILIKEIDAKNLNQLNEGWYKTINGNLFYLEGFDRPVYLYARINNPEYKNEIFSVDADGNLEFFGNNSLNNGNNKPKLTSNNQISGNVVGMESVSGMQSAAPTSTKILINGREYTAKREGTFITTEIVKEKYAYSTTTGKLLLYSQGATYGPYPGWIELSTKGTDSASQFNAVVNTQLNGANAVLPQPASPPAASAPPSPASAAAPPASSTTGVGPVTPPPILENAHTEPTLWVQAKNGQVFEVYRKDDKYFYKGTSDYVDSKDLSVHVYTTVEAVTSQGLIIQPQGTKPGKLPAAAGQTSPQVLPAGGDTPPLPGAAASNPPPLPTTTVYKKPQDIPSDGKIYKAMGIHGEQFYRKVGNSIFEYKGQKTDGTWQGDWVPATFKYTIVATINGQQLYEIKEFTDGTAANTYAQSKYGALSPIVRDGDVSALLSTANTPNAAWTLVEFGGKKFAVKGKEFQEVPSNQYNNPESFIQELKDIDTLRNQFAKFSTDMKKAGATNDKDILQAFMDANPGKHDLLNKAFKDNLQTANQAAQANRDPLKSVRQEGNTYFFVDSNGKIYTNDKDEAPPALTRVVNFKKDYLDKGAQPVTNLKDSAGNQIYSFKGKYVSIASDDVPQGIREEDIGGVKYPVTYSLANGRMAAAGIKLGDEPSTPITDLQLRQLRSYGKVSGNLIKNSEGRLQFSFTSPPKKVGDNEQTSTTNVEFFAKGPTETKTIQVKDRNGNIISLKETTNEYYEETTTATGEKRYVFGLSSQKNYKLGEVETSINPMTSDYTEITTDPATGQPTKLTIREKGIESSAQYVNGQVTGTGKAKDRLSTEISQYKSRQFFAGFQFIFTEFRGLGYIPSLFGFDDDSLIEWRNGVDKVFSTLYLGTEYWSSKICTATAGLATENEGIAYAETPQGMAQIGAHIEATKTQPIVTENGTSYIYKITFQVKNGDYEKDQRAPENMSINVFIIPKDQDISSGIQIFKKNVNVGRGSSFGRFGNNAIVQESKTVYDKICIKFDKIPLKWKINNNILCNRIEDNTYAQPTALQQRNAAQQGSNADMNNW